MSKRAPRQTRKDLRTRPQADPRLELGQDFASKIERAGKKAGFSPDDLGKGLDKDELKVFAESIAKTLHPAEKPAPVQPDVVTSYMESLMFFQNHASDDRTESSYSERQGKQQARQYWATLRDARIIELSPKLYMNIHHEVDVFTTEKIVGQKWLPADQAAESQETTLADFAERINKAAREVTFPPKLPFPSVYLGLAEPVEFPYDSGSFSIRAIGAFRNHVTRPVRMSVLGYLVSEDLCVLEFLRIESETGENYLTGFSAWADPGGWAVPNTGLPWTINILIDFINSHQSLVLEKHGFESQRRWKKSQKALNIKRPIPPPYYTVHIRDQVIEEKLAGLRGARKHTFSFSHRHDVRAHEAVRIDRGLLPISDKLRKRFSSNSSRRLYVTEHLRADDAERLAKRGIPPKRADEWMAILVSEVKAHIRPLDPKLPYIPAIRKLPERSHAQP